MRVGGSAEWLLEPTTPDELHRAWVAVHEAGSALRLLGAGADVIVGDGLHRCVVIATSRLDRVFRPGTMEDDENAFEVQPENVGRVAQPPRDQDPRLVAWCGASLPGLVRAASELGWSGLEGLVGVPGRLGGAVTTNAGGRWGELWDVIETVRVLDEAGEVRDLKREDCSPAYRDGRLGSAIVIGAVLRLQSSTRAEVQDRARSYLLEKNAVQPVTQASAGCIFKNPDREVSDGRSAGQLIDDLGLKGLRRGAAQVSLLHGNFIINLGGARAADVLGLADEVAARVADDAGVQLEREVRTWLADQQ